MIFENYFWLLYGVSFFTSTISAAVGFIGGTILLTVMAQFIAAPLLIPLHGLVQMWSNVSRLLFMRRHVHWPIAWRYFLGAIGGALVGAFGVRSLPTNYFGIALGILILVMTLVPKDMWARGMGLLASCVGAPRPSQVGSAATMPSLNKWIVYGAFASFIGLFVGAIGVLVGSLFLAENLEKRAIIGTQAFCQTIGHVTKVAVYLYLGFQMAPWLLLLGGMIGAAWLGSYVGAKVLDKIPNEVFFRIFKWLIVILSLRLVWEGITAL